MKRIVYILLASLTLFASCKKSTTDPTPDKGEVYIELGIDMSNNQPDGGSANYAPKALTKSLGVPGKPGSIMIDIDDFGETPVALFAIGGAKWATVDRLINDLKAMVTINAETSTEGIISYTNPVAKAYFPADGALNIYSMYPMVTSGPISFTDEGVVKPTVNLTIADIYLKQYDILHAKLENQTVAQAQSLQLQYEHTLAQLQIVIVRAVGETEELKGKIFKVAVDAAYKASFPIDNQSSDAMTVNRTDIQSHIAYESVDGVQVTGTADTLNKINWEAEDGPTVYGPLMLIPGVDVVKSITLTLDGGNEITVPISNFDKAWTLKQGAKNVLTLNFSSFNVITADEWTVAPWEDGTTHDEALAPQGRMTTLVTSLCGGDQVVANPSIVPTHADIEIEGNAIIKDVEVSVTDGVLTTAEFDSKIIHDQNIQVTAIKLYSDTDVVLFEGKLYGADGTTSSPTPGVLYIDQNDEILKRAANITAEGSEVVLNTLFKGFGDGTSTFPYEVSSPETLSNLRHFPGSAGSTIFTGRAAVGAFFKQVADITLSDIFTPIMWECGSFDGGGFKINNLRIDQTPINSATSGLFGELLPNRYVEDNSRSEIKNVTIASGSIYRRGSQLGYCGAIVGEVKNALITRCVNYATVSAEDAPTYPKGSGIGGIVGFLGGGATIAQCANFGLVEGDNRTGGVAGLMQSTASMKECFNAGQINQLTEYTTLTGGIGGLIGNFTNAATTVIENSYNVGQLTTGGANAGLLIGYVSSATALPSAVKGIYYLAVEGGKPIGRERVTGAPYAKEAISKTAAEMKSEAFVTLLNGAGDVWELNTQIPGADGGLYFYPVFNWMK